VTFAPFPTTPARALGALPASRFSVVQSGVAKAVPDDNNPQHTVTNNARIQGRCTGECTHAGRGRVNVNAKLFTNSRQFREQRSTNSASR